MFFSLMKGCLGKDCQVFFCVMKGCLGEDCQVFFSVMKGRVKGSVYLQGCGADDTDR